MWRCSQGRPFGRHSHSRYFVKSLSFLGELADRERVFCFRICGKEKRKRMEWDYEMGGNLLRVI